MTWRLNSSGRAGVTAAFVGHSIISGSWASRIPAIKHGVGLSDGQLGLALFGMAAGVLVGARLGGIVAERVGARRVVRLGVPAFGAALCVTAVAGNLVVLTGTLIAFGVIAGGVDVAMNSAAVVVERGYGSPLMSGFHGLWSLGMLAGAIIGIGAAGVGVRPVVQFALVAAIVVAVSAPLLAQLPRRKPRSDSYAKARGAWSVGVVSLGLIAFCAFFAEGSAADWSAVFLRDRVGASSAIAASGFACFSLGMVSARLSGDRLAAAIGPVRLVVVSTLVAALGLMFALLVPNALSGVIGFGLLGVGLGPVVPTVVSAAGGASPEMLEDIVSRVFTIGYVGGVSGPALIGFASSRVGLRAALLIPLCFVLVVTISARQLATAAGRPTSPTSATR